MPEPQHPHDTAQSVATHAGYGPSAGPSALDLPGFFDDDTDFADDEAAPVAHQPWWRRPRWIALMAGALLVVLLIGIVAAVVHARQAKITYTTQQVAQGTLTTTVSATGPLQSGVYNVNFSGSGKISEIDVSVGQQVQSGQTLAKLDPTSLQDALNSAQIAVNSAQTALNNAENNQGQVAAQTRASVNAAYDQEQASLAKCASGDTTCTNQAEAQYASAQAQANAQNSSAQGQVNTAQAQLSAAQANLQTAQHNLSNTTLTAPHAGTIGAINGSVGGTPGSGSASGSGSGASSSGGAFIEILDLSSLQVLANINEADIGHIAVGQSVVFTVSAYGTRRFRGTVSTISPLGQSSSNVVTYPVTITVDPQSVQGANLLPQMTANATVTTAQRTGVLLVSAQAITFARTQLTSGAITRRQVVAATQQARQLLLSAQASDPTAAQDNLTVSFVLERSNNQWVIKPVVLGLSNGTAYEVLAGLSAGDSIVVSQQGGSASSSGASTTGTGSSLIPGGGRGGFGGGGFGGGGFGGGRGGSGTGGASGSGSTSGSGGAGSNG